MSLSILRDIQNDAINSSVSISALLRKCKVLATRLNNEEIKAWVDDELNGYKSIDNVPEYRKLAVQSYGNFVGMGWSQVNHQPIPPSSIPAKHREFITTEYLMQPISYYESLVEETKGINNDLKVDWPADLVAHVANKILSGMTLRNAWKQLTRSSLVALVDTVRTRILNFVLELEHLTPDIEYESSRTLSHEKVSQIFNTVVLGNVTNLTAYEQINITVIQNDIESLLKYLSSHGIEQDDLEELRAVIQENSQSEPKGKPSDKVKAWIGKMMMKAADGTWKVGIGAAGALLAKAIEAYFGISH